MHLFKIGCALLALQSIMRTSPGAAAPMAHDPHAAGLALRNVTNPPDWDRMIPGGAPWRPFAPATNATHEDQTATHTMQVVAVRNLDFDRRPDGVCVSVDSATFTRHAPEGCNRESLILAGKHKLIGGKRMAGGTNVALICRVQPLPGSFRSEISLPSTPIDKSRDSRTTYSFDVAFPEPMPERGDPIFFQVKECGGALKQEFGNGCSRPVFALKITPAGEIQATTNVVQRVDGTVREIKNKRPLLTLGPEHYGTTNFLHVTVTLNRQVHMPLIEVIVQGEPLYRFSGPFGAPDATSEYVKVGAYLPNWRAKGPGAGPVTVLIDNLQAVHAA